MLSPEFRSFCVNWRAKADECRGANLESTVDRFFTLFVVYNRLYAEVTFHMARAGQINLANRKTFPDAKAATDYVAQFLGSRNIVELLEGDHACDDAIKTIALLLDGDRPGGHRFAIKLDMIYGNPQDDVDRELLHNLRSGYANKKAKAVLEFLYAVRCNLFHGHKGFEPVQSEVMQPATVLLARITDILFRRLSEQ